MKKVAKFFMAALLAGISSFGYAQDYLGAPKAHEKVLETISLDRNMFYSDNNTRRSDNGGSLGTKINWYMTLLETAKQKYPNRTIDIRNMVVGKHGINYAEGLYDGPATGKIVWSPQETTQESLPQALNKALRNVREGSRLAIDQVSVTSNIDKGNSQRPTFGCVVG